MELSPARKTSIRYQFEVYCKKVLRGERCDYLRQVIRRGEREVTFSDLAPTFFDSQGIEDDYPSNQYEFEVRGQRVLISDGRLGEALSKISTDGRDLLLLAYFLELNDREIGELLETPRSTVQRRRQQFLAQMKQMMKE